MTENFKPDFGTLFLKQFGNIGNQNFYYTLCVDILHVGEDLYSFMSSYSVNNMEYAISFDFSEEKLKSLLSQIENDDFRKYLESILLKPFTTPNKAAFYDSPLTIDIVAQIGEPVISMYETFVPFIVKEFKNVGWEAGK